MHHRVESSGLRQTKAQRIQLLSEAHRGSGYAFLLRFLRELLLYPRLLQDRLPFPQHPAHLIDPSQVAIKAEHVQAILAAAANPKTVLCNLPHWHRIVGRDFSQAFFLSTFNDTQRIQRSFVFDPEAQIIQLWEHSKYR